MALNIGNVNLDGAVLLAPLAGITDLPFRELVSSYGAALVVSEMVASQEMVQSRPSAQARAELGAGLQNTSVQIAGRDPYWMAECAKLVAGQGARIIDINMGCPAKKVTNGYSGAALMREPDFALSLIEAVVAAVDVPVTLKMRLGWDQDCLTAPRIAKRAEDAGIQMITIHGRTRQQFYKGQADWAAIAHVKNAVNVPVIANGDITSAQAAQEALRLSGADGVMIGRGAQGRPWLLRDVQTVLDGGTPQAPPQRAELITLIIRHYSEMLSFYGAELGLRVARKHLGWYLDTFGQISPQTRRTILTERDPDSVISALQGLVEPNDMEAAA